MMRSVQAGTMILLCYVPMVGGSLPDGEKAYRLRASSFHAQSALTHFRTATLDRPNDSEAQWRLAMACHFVGNRFTPDSAVKQALFLEGEAAGRKCMALNPESPACLFWTAVNLALFGEEVGPLRTLKLLPQIRRLLDDTLALDPAYAYGGASRVLGLIAQKLPGILGGSNREAKSHFERAIRHAPDEPMNYLFLARLLRDDMDKPEAARLIVNESLKLPPLPFDRVEGKEAEIELGAWH